MSGINLSMFGNVTITNIAPNLYDVNVFNNLRNTLSNNLTLFKNVSFYEYALDGTSVYISDGGGDMYDNGNYTHLFENGSQILTNLDYNTTNSTVGNLRYGSLGYARPLTVIAVTQQNISRRFGMGRTGNEGAGGGGNVSSEIVYPVNSVVGGFIVHAWMKSIYNASDPSIQNLYVSIGHNNWNSTFQSADVMSYATNTDNGQSQYETTTTNNLLMTTLLSKAGGVKVTIAEAQTVIQNFVGVIKGHFGY